MNTCLWHSYFCCSNTVVIVGVSFASTVCPIQYTVDQTSACRKFVMSVIRYSFETLPHTSALNHHIHQTNFLMWRFITVVQKILSLSSFVLYIYICTQYTKLPLVTSFYTFSLFMAACHVLCNLSIWHSSPDNILRWVHCTWCLSLKAWLIIPVLKTKTFRLHSFELQHQFILE